MNQLQFHFQGIFVPAAVIYRILAKEINQRDLLFMILVRGLTEKPGKGCYAENKYLATSLGVVASRIPQIIRKLKNLGMLKVYWKNENRYLETTWEENPKTAEGHITALQGGYNGVIGQGYNAANPSIIDEEENNENTHCPDLRKPACVGFQFGSDNDKPVPLEQKLVQSYYKLLLEHGKVLSTEYRPRTWLKQFRQAIQLRSLETVHQALTAYSKHFRDQFMVRCYDGCHSAKKFCDNILRILDCAARIEGKQLAQSNNTEREIDHVEHILQPDGKTYKPKIHYKE